MDISLVPSEKTGIFYPKGYEGKYASFEVGYIGDKAGVNFAFVKAVNSQGTQHLKHKEKHYEVVTIGDAFYLEALKIKLSSNHSDEDRTVLNDGYKALEDFISRNGQTNPVCAQDFEYA